MGRVRVIPISFQGYSVPKETRTWVERFSGKSIVFQSFETLEDIVLQEMARVIGVTLVEGDLFHTRILLQMCNCNQFETSYRPAAKQLQYIPGASNFDNIELIFMYKATYV